MKKILSVEGMSCGHCVMHVKSALEEVQGVSSVDVDLLKKQAVVEGAGLIDSALSTAVAEAGYSVSAIVGDR